MFCVGYTAVRFVLYALPDMGKLNVNSIIQYIVPFVVGIVGVVIAISMLLKSQYELTETELKTRFGIIVSTYAIEDITAVHLFTKTKKLAVYFKGDKYLVIVVKEEWYRDFIKELLKRNGRIAYDESEDEKEDN